MNFKNLVSVGLTLEVLILIGSYLFSTDIPEMFMYAARYSGRLSLVAFLYTTWSYSQSKKDLQSSLSKTKAAAGVFAILHYKHLILLAINIKLNGITLIPHKLVGGALAYLMILLYPMFFERIKDRKAIHLIYFFYVGFVMIMTYIGRIKGEFEGAQPETFHTIGLVLVVLSLLYLGYQKLIRKV